MIDDDLNKKPKRRYGLGDPDAEVVKAPVPEKPAKPKRRTITDAFEEAQLRAREARETMVQSILLEQAQTNYSVASVLNSDAARERDLRKRVPLYVPSKSEGCFIFTARDLGDADYVADSAQAELAFKERLCVILHKTPRKLLVAPYLYEIERVRDEVNPWIISGFRIVFSFNTLQLSPGDLIEAVIAYDFIPTSKRVRPPNPPHKHCWPYSIP